VEQRTPRWLSCKGIGVVSTFSLVIAHGIDPPAFVPLGEHVIAAVRKSKTRARHEVHHGSRHENLARFRERGHAAADVDDDAVRYAGDHVAFTGMQSEPHAGARALCFGDNRARAPDGAGRAVEDDEDAVLRDANGVAAETRRLLDDQAAEALERGRRSSSTHSMVTSARSASARLRALARKRSISSRSAS
jgi:hypothetical protein